MGLAETFKTIDALIREGKAGTARRLFREAYSHRVPFEHAVEAARISRRLDVPYVGLRILDSALRGLKDVPVELTIAYSECLTKAGAPREAWRLLMELPAANLPPVADFAKATALVEQWDYEAAIPHLRRYAEAKGLPDYTRLIAQVNLAAALVYERKFLEASYLLHRLFDVTGARKLHLLRANLYEITAYQFIAHRKYDRAARLLEEASAFLKETGSNEAFFVRKWRAVLDLLREGEHRPLDDIKEAARKQSLWETLRDCERFQALSDRDADLGRHVYFGTAYPSFRDRFLKDFEGDLRLDESYHWRLGEGGGRPYEIHLADGTGPQGKNLFAAGRLTHRLLGTLASDFFHPFRVPTLFESLFPGEHFNPDSGPQRVRQALKLLRRTLSEERVPLEIEKTPAGYRLIGKAPCVIVFSPSERGAAKFDLLISRLAARWPTESFTAAQAAQLLGVSVRTTQRVLASAAAQNRIRSSATVPVTYRFL